ncbi:MAG: diguanylate cyclase [archaeon]
MAGERRVGRRDPQRTFAEMQSALSALQRDASSSGVLRRTRLSQGGLVRSTFLAALAKARVRQMLLLDAKFHIEDDAVFNERLYRFLRSRKAKAPFSFAMVDMDFLHKLNRELGQHGADKKLELLVEKISGIAKRHRGFAGRCGGDEFKIFVPRRSSLLVAELRGALAELRAERISFSCGVAGSKGLKGLLPPQFVERLNEKVDAALINSKRLGRARVTVA